MNDFKTTFDVQFTVNDITITKVEVTVDPNKEYIETVLFQTKENKTWTFPSFITDREYLLDLTKEYLEYGYEVLMEWFHTLLDVYPTGYVSNSGWTYDPTTQHIKSKITKLPESVDVGNGITFGGFAIDHKSSDLQTHPYIRPVDVRNRHVIQDSFKWEIPVRHIAVGMGATEVVKDLFDGEMQICKNTCMTMLQLYPHGISDPKPSEKELTIVKELEDSVMRCNETIDENFRAVQKNMELLEEFNEKLAVDIKSVKLFKSKEVLLLLQKAAIEVLKSGNPRFSKVLSNGKIIEVIKTEAEARNVTDIVDEFIDDLSEAPIFSVKLMEIIQDLEEEIRKVEQMK